MMTTGQALKDQSTVLGRAVVAQRKRREQMKKWTPEQQEAFWRQAARSTR